MSEVTMAFISQLWLTTSSYTLLKTDIVPTSIPQAQWVWDISIPQHFSTLSFSKVSFFVPFSSPDLALLEVSHLIFCLGIILFSILLGCEGGRLFIGTSKNEYETMEVQNNSVIINCDGLYLIHLKGSFFQEVKINFHFRKDRSPIFVPMLNNGQRVVFTVVTSLAFKDEVYLTVNASDTLCEHLQINDGELIIVQLTPNGYCAPERPYSSTVNQVPLWIPLWGWTGHRFFLARDESILLNSMTCDGMQILPHFLTQGYLSRVLHNSWPLIPRIA